ncbi:carotenoid ester lipase precursor [Artomyces pyxidatus]|uniref:Carotenoid ester lipase n=1 Tax=Artomyces pyxidatus TaxID=48021 RepID=A0ACB8SUY1_9AGAM|nr:carotenoid ester lipase precursor [Artomyces pyxidatus]
MHGLSHVALIFVSSRAISYAAATIVDGIPSVQLDEGTFIGNLSGNVSQFLGIPFAQPPVGNLRFQLPQPNAPYTGIHNATDYGPSCIQQNTTQPIPSGLDPLALQFLELEASDLQANDQSEDCLSINVMAPADASSNSKLPVVAWIYGGGFETGGTASETFGGSGIVQRSIELGQPVLFVSFNYRLNALGFLAGAEVEKNGLGNIGLHDQRQALRWMHKYVNAFGGDPDKVTIWGASAGAASVGLHMITNGGNTEGLFRAAFMQSGSPGSAGTLAEGQPYYDALVADVGCSDAQDTLQCLREAPLQNLTVAINNSPNTDSYQSLNIAWAPRVDGIFLKDSPQQLVLKGSVANIPFVTGDCDDEGTAFSLASVNITTDQAVLDYFHGNYFPKTSTRDIERLLQLYPNDTRLGSPFDTGTANAVAPQYKRIAAIQGDMMFQAPRRFFLQQRSSQQDTYSFLSKRFKYVPDFGATHGTDVANIYGPGDLTDYLVRFVATLNPNGDTGIFWPLYTVEAPRLLTLWDGAVPLNITNDTYRTEGTKFLTQLSLTDPDTF